MTTNEKDAAMAVHATGEEDASSKPDMGNDTIPMPESLSSMTEVEIATLKKKMVRKMDLVIM